ncbi:MAG: CvpA family protein [Chloroflexi bacterium]|nr:CvpA family protein [Chloroflexota bacterium]
MNWLDVIIILVIAWFTFAAFTAGIIREAVTLIATLVAIVVAGFYYDDLARDVLLFIDNQKVAFVVGFLILLGSVFLAGQLVAFLLKRAASLLMLGWADHLAGAGFGLLKGFLVVEILLILFVTYPQLGLDDTIDGSALAPFFLDLVPVLVRILPGEFGDAVDKFTA